MSGSASFVADQQEAARRRSGRHRAAAGTRPRSNPSLGTSVPRLAAAGAVAAARAGQRVGAEHRRARARRRRSAPVDRVVDLGDLARIGRLGEALPGEQAARLLGPLAGGKGERGQVGGHRDRPADQIGRDDPPRLGRAARSAPASSRIRCRLPWLCAARMIGRSVGAWRGTPHKRRARRDRRNRARAGHSSSLVRKAPNVAWRYLGAQIAPTAVERARLAAHEQARAVLRFLVVERRVPGACARGSWSGGRRRPRRAGASRRR